MNQSDSGIASTQKSQVHPGDSAAIVEGLEKNSVLDQTPIEQSDDPPAFTSDKGISRQRLVGITLLGVGLIVGGLLVFKSSLISSQQSALNSAQPVKPQSFLLPDLSSQLSKENTKA